MAKPTMHNPTHAKPMNKTEKGATGEQVHDFPEKS